MLKGFLSETPFWETRFNRHYVGEAHTVSLYTTVCMFAKGTILGILHLIPCENKQESKQANKQTNKQTYKQTIPDKQKTNR